MDIKKEFKKFIELNPHHYEYYAEFEDSILYDVKSIKELENNEDLIHEVADNCVDIYNCDLLKWVVSSIDGIDYIEQAVQEYGLDTKNFNFYNLIRLGQYHYSFERITELYNDFLEYLKKVN